MIHFQSYVLFAYTALHMEVHLVETPRTASKGTDLDVSDPLPTILVRSTAN